MQRASSRTRKSGSEPLFRSAFRPQTHVIQYRIPGLGRRSFAKRITLAEHGVLTAEEARRLARRELGKVAQESNPAADRAARTAAPTVIELGERYLEEVSVTRKARTAVEYRRVWDKHVVPALGSRQIAEIVQADIRRLHRALAKTPYLANRMVAMLSAFFTYTAREGVGSPNNPAHGVEFFPEKARERFLTPKEFGQLGKALGSRRRPRVAAGRTPPPQTKE